MKRPTARTITLSAKIHDAIRNQITDGIYRSGSGLPSSRALAAELGVARSTVTVAFEQLAAEGYLEMSQGSRPRVPHSLRSLEASRQRRRPVKSIAELSDFARRLLAFGTQDRLSGLSVDFRYGDLAGADFPESSWRQVINTILSRPNKSLKYDDPLGSLPLRKALRAYLWRSRGVRSDEEQIVIVNGSQQGIDLCARLLLNPGDKVVVEEPGYMLARHAFEAVGATSVPICVDQDGMQTALLDNVAARLAFVTPSHQFPLGGILPVSRRQDLLAWSRKGRAFIIEDDYDGEYRYDTKPTETLHSLDPEGRVIYLGTLSKALSPELRLGYLVAPAELAPAFALAKRLTDRHSPLLQQRATQALIETGSLERHIRRIRRSNGKRRAMLLSQIELRLGSQICVVGTAAGLHVVVWFNQIPLDRENELVSEAGRRGLGLYGITPLYSSNKARRSEPRAGVVLGYAALSESQIAKGIQILGTLLREFRDGSEQQLP